MLEQRQACRKMLVSLANGFSFDNFLLSFLLPLMME